MEPNFVGGLLKALCSLGLGAFGSGIVLTLLAVTSKKEKEESILLLYHGAGRLMLSGIGLVVAAIGIKVIF